MKQPQISELYQLLKRTTCRVAVGGSATAYAQFMNSYTRFSFEQGRQLREYLASVHPFFAVRYAFPWHKDKSVIDTKFWSNFNASWEEICYKKKWAFSDGLESYDWNTLKKEVALLFVDDKGNAAQLPSSVTDDVKSDPEWPILFLMDRKEKEAQRKAEEEERKRRELDEKIKEAQRAGLARKQREAEEERRRFEKNAAVSNAAEANRQIANGAKPWNSSVVTQPSIPNPGSGASLESQPVDLNNVFEVADNLDFLQPRYPQPDDWEVSVKSFPPVGSKSSTYQLKFGKAVSRCILDSGFSFFHFLTDAFGQRYIYFNNVPGLKMATPQTKSDGSANVVINSKEVCDTILSLYGLEKFAMIALSHNKSQNDTLVAFLIESVKSS